MAALASAWRSGMARAGATIVVAGRDAAKNAAAVSRSRRPAPRRAPFRSTSLKEDSCRALIADTVKAHGRLDILVNNAGMSIRKQPEQYTLAEWHTVMDSNLTSAFLCSHAAYPEMKKGGSGKIINIGSMMSIFGAPFATAYAASKGGMVQMTKAMATAWAKDNIQVNADPAGLDRHRPDPRARASRSRACTTTCSSARRPAAGASRRTSPASRSSWRRRRRIS